MTRRILGQFYQQPNEVLRYSIDYSRWLETGETLASVVDSVAPETTPPFVADQIFLNPAATGLTFVASGGVDTVDYQLTLRVTTTTGQVVEREILFGVEET